MATSDKKQQILNTAKDLFLTRGFKATTIQNIADAADVSKGAVYLHFSSKQDIIYEMSVQAEMVIWQQVEAIHEDSSIDAKQRLVKILHAYIDYIHENRVLIELMVSEAGIALTDEQLAKTMAMRQRWQKTIDSIVLEYLGGEYEPWKADLGFCLNALMEGFHALLLMENIEISTDALTPFLLLMVETMGPALKTKKMTPLLGKDYLERRDQQLSGIETSRQNDIELVLTKIDEIVAGRAPSDSQPSSEHDILKETVRILARECKSNQPNLALVQGMLSSLRVVDELSLCRHELSQLMRVKLV